MATKKSTTKAKTKTTQSKKSAKTAAAKTANVKKTVTKAAAKTAKPTKPVAIKKTKLSKFGLGGANLLALRRLHMFTAAVFVILIGVAWSVMSSTSYQLIVGHLAKDELASTQSTVLAPAVRALYDVEIRFIVIGILLISAILPLLYATKLEQRYAENLRTTRMLPWRWLDFGVTMGLILETAALLSGVHDVFVLKLIGGLVLLTYVLGLIAERQNNASEKPVWSAYLASIFSGFLPWLLITAYAVSTVVFGGVRSPWYVYALYAAIFVGLKLIALNQWKQHRKTGHWQNYLLVERNYVILSLLTKATFAIILIVGIS